MLKLGSHPKVYQCSFCGKDASQVEKLVAGPDDIYICDRCVKLVAELLNVKLNDENLTATSEKDNDLWQSSFNHSQKYSEPKLKSTTKVCKCSFCGKSESQVEKLVAGSNNVCICGKCTKLCLEVLEDTVNPKI